MWCYEKFSAKPLLIFVCVMVSPHPPPPSPNCLYLFKSSVWQIIVHLPAGKTVNPAALCPPHHPSSSPSPQPLESNALDPLFVLMSEVSLTVTAPPTPPDMHTQSPGVAWVMTGATQASGSRKFRTLWTQEANAYLGGKNLVKERSLLFCPPPGGVGRCLISGRRGE